jgi:general secretion pathway protein D
MLSVSRRGRTRITYQSVGIILRVTPFITSDGKVEMIVSPETSALADRSQWVPIAAGITAPVINSRVADTVVVIPDGQTVVIGGLMEKSKLATDSKIPFLGDIPIIGNLFKRKVKDDSKTELMIFLTPYIVQDAAQLASLSDRERKNTELAPKAFTEEDMDLFLKSLPGKAHDEKDSKKKKKKE